MLQIILKSFKIGFECFESISNGLNSHLNTSIPFSNVSNLDLNASNPFLIVQICIRMLRIPFRWFEPAFELIESHSKGSNLPSNVSNFVQMVAICIQMVRIPFDCLKFAFECFKSFSNHSFKRFKYVSNGLKLHSNASNPFLNGSNLDSNASNPF